MVKNIHGQFLAVVIACMLLAGCGAVDLSASDTANDPSLAAKGVVVVPYISGAVFFEDMNNNGVRDTGEQVSSKSAASGTFAFPAPLTLGSTLVMDMSLSTAIHNGVGFAGKLKRKVDETRNLTVSPITTLLANGLTEQQLIDLLAEAGLRGVTAADLRDEPMAGLDQIRASAVTDSDLQCIRANQMIHAFMAIVNGYDYRYTDFTSDRKALLARMFSLINTSLATNLFAVNNAVIAAIADQVPFMPSLMVGDVVRGAAAITEVIIRKTILNPNYDPTSDLHLWLTTLAPRFYLLRNLNNDVINMAMRYTHLLDEIIVVPWQTFITLTTFMIDPVTNLVTGK